MARLSTQQIARALGVQQRKIAEWRDYCAFPGPSLSYREFDQYFDTAHVSAWLNSRQAERAVKALGSESIEDIRANFSTRVEKIMTEISTVGREEPHRRATARAYGNA